MAWRRFGTQLVRYFTVCPQLWSGGNELRLISASSRLFCRLLDIPRLTACYGRAISTISSTRMSPALYRTSYNSVYGTSHNSGSPAVLPQRNVVRFSKNKGKMKSVKAVVKRFKRTGHGKLKRWRANCHHNSLRKNRKQRKKNKKGVFVSRPQLKLLNKMLSNR